MNDYEQPAFPQPHCPMCGTDHQPHLEKGMTLRQHYAGLLTAAWIQSLAQRRGEPGYDDESAADEAARLGTLSADRLIEIMAQLPTTA